jgi:hypothetical protein
MFYCLVLTYNSQKQDQRNDDVVENKRRANRALTQRYDMHALRKIQKIEDDFRSKLSLVYGCDPDDIPIELDTLSIYNAEVSQRRSLLV